MAKFRTNHARNGSSGGGGMMVKVGIFSALIAGLYYIFQLFSGEAPAQPDASASDGGGRQPARTETRAAADHLPEGSQGQVIAYRKYHLSYNESHEQADWVAYVLRRDDFEGEANPREDNFLPDPRVKTGTATPDDYRGSGYDRGHLVPAADMAYDIEALAETFFMSNISPQARDFNQGVWRELEELTRNWARRFEELYVVSGPILSKKPKGVIGRENEVSVPVAYYKVLLDASEPEQKGIAFIIPNEVSFDPLTRYAVSIDEAEAQTGFNFFPELMPDALEKQLEGQFNIDLWPFSKQKYDLRVNKWNNVK